MKKQIIIFILLVLILFIFNKILMGNFITNSTIVDTQDLLSGLLRQQRSTTSGGTPFDLESKGDVSEVESFDGLDDGQDVASKLDNNSSNDVLRYGGDLEDDRMSDVSVHDVERRPERKTSMELSEKEKNDLVALMHKMNNEI